MFFFIKASLYTLQHCVTLPPLWQLSHWCNPQAFQITPVGVTFYTNLQRVSFPQSLSVCSTQNQSAHKPHSTDESFPGKMLSVSIPHWTLCPCLTLFVCPFEHVRSSRWCLSAHTGVVVLYAKHAPVTKALLHIRREICSAYESKQTCICKNMCPWSVRHCFSVYVRGLARLIKASMGWCTLSQASVTGQTTSAAGQPSAPIVSEAQHSPARMAGLVKAVPFPPLFSSIPPSVGQNDFLISQKGQQKWSIKLEKGSISRLIFENGR